MVNRKALVATLLVFDLTLTLSLGVFVARAGSATIPQATQPLQPGDPSCTLSASVSGNTATFSGSISGLIGLIHWTLSFGDGSSLPGTGATVSAMYTYSQAGTYYPYLNANDDTGAMAFCTSNPVVIGRQLSLGVNETMIVSDEVVVVPPLTVNEMVNVLDVVPLVAPLMVLENFTISEIVQRLVAIPSLLVNETVGVGDSNSGPFPPGVGESARFSDQVSITQGSNNPFGAFPGGVVGIIAVGVGAAVAVLAIVWKFVLPRRLS